MKYEFCRVTSEKTKLQLNCNATRQGTKVRHGIFVFVNPTRSRVTFCVDAFSKPEILTKRICISILRIQFGYLQHFSIFSIMFHIFLPCISFLP